MKFYKENKKKLFYSKKNKIKRNIFLLLSIIIIFFLGILTERNEIDKIIYKKFNNFIDVFSQRIFSRTLQNDKIVLDINYRNYNKILKSRSESLKYFRADKDFQKWASGKLTFKGDEYKIRIRLKGVFSDHWGDPKKWSFKIKILDNQSIFGLRRFSIQHPRTVNYLYQWLYVKILEHEKLINHRILFKEIVMNGDSLGLYIIQEQISKELIENNKRREGPVIGFDKSLWIRSANKSKGFYINRMEDSFLRAKITPVQFSENKIGTEQEIYLKRAITKLEMFRNEKIPLDEFISVDQLAKIMSVKAIIGSSEFDWKDIKFYYNPITDLLEPIVIESHVDESFRPKKKHWWIDSYHPYRFSQTDKFLDLIYKNKKFQKEYLLNLQKMTKDHYIENIFNKHKKEYNDIKKYLKKFYPTQKLISFDYLKSNKEKILNALNPVQGLNVYFVDYKDNEIIFNISNLQRFPVEIFGLQLDNKGPIYIKKPLYLEGTKINNLPKKNTLKIQCNYGEECSQKMMNNHSIIYKFVGQTKEKKAKISKFYFNEFKKEKYSDLSKLDYLIYDPDRKLFKFKKGTWNISEKLLIPKNNKIVIENGTQLILLNEAHIVSYSPLFIYGTKTEPVIISSNFQGDLNNYREKSKKTDTENFGSGILVLNTNEKSIIENTIFQKLSAPKISSGKGLLGAINFYKADVVLNNVTFLDNLYGDDYLNIINSNFELKNSLFENTVADAIDIDFGNGIIENLEINNTGNDAIDFSGSNVTIKNINISGAGDKGVSVGENSKLNIENIIISNSNLGVASKDLSTVKINKIKIFNTNYGFVAYQKKPEFGSSKISINSLDTDNVLNKFLSENNSIIVVNNNKIKNIEFDYNIFK